MIKKIIKTRFFRDNLAFMIGTVVVGILGYLFHFAVSRQISVAIFGELQSLLAVAMVLGIFGSSLSYYVIRHTAVFAAKNQPELNRKFVVAVFRGIRNPMLLFLAVYCISLPFLKYFLHFESYSGLVIVGISVTIVVYSAVYQETLRSWHLFLDLSAVGIYSAFSKFAIGFFLALYFKNASVVSLALIVSSLLGLIPSKKIVEKKIFGKTARESEDNSQQIFFEKKDRVEFLEAAFFTLAIALIFNIDVLLVKNMTSAELTGYYAALSVLGKIILWLNLSIIGVVMPRIFSGAHTGKRLEKKIMFSSYAAMFGIGVSVSLLYFFAGKYFVGLLFGDHYLIYSKYLWMFGISALLLSLIKFEANIAYAERDKMGTIFVFGIAVLMIAGTALYHMSLFAVTGVVIISELIGYLGIFFRNRFRKINLELSEVLNKKI